MSYLWQAGRSFFFFSKLHLYFSDLRQVDATRCWYCCCRSYAHSWQLSPVVAVNCCSDLRSVRSVAAPLLVRICWSKCCYSWILSQITILTKSEFINSSTYWIHLMPPQPRFFEQLLFHEQLSEGILLQLDHLLHSLCSLMMSQQKLAYKSELRTANVRLCETNLTCRLSMS